MSMSTRKNPAILLVTTAAALTLVLSGCSADNGADPAAEPQGSEHILGSVETKYGTVEVPAPADGEELRVVALGWSDGEVALSLGVKPVAIFELAVPR